MADINHDDFKTIVEYLHTKAAAIGSIEQRIVYIETSIRKFERIVTDGNGHPSLISQIASLKSDQAQLKSSQQVFAAEQKAFAQERMRAIMAVIVALIAAVAAFLKKG